MTIVIGSSPVLQCLARSTLALFRRKSGDPHPDHNFERQVKDQQKHLVVLAVCLFILGVTAPLSAQKSVSVESGPARQMSLVHHGDLIDVDVLGGFEFDWRGTITPDGHLDGLQTFDEPIYALCRTEKEIAVDIAKAYSKILRDPKVEVRIIDRSNRALARVDGAVRTPTRFSIRREVSLRELIVMSGGIVSGASDEISIFRPADVSCVPAVVDHGSGRDNRSTSLNIKISDLLSGKASFDPVILSGDIVTVSRANPVYVIGAVNNPGAIFATTELTVTRAIATAGGMTKDANGEAVTVFRRTGKETSILELDLAKVKRGEVEDTPLQSFDIIDVHAKGGSKRTYPPVALVSDTLGSNWTQMPLKIVD